MPLQSNSDTRRLLNHFAEKLGWRNLTFFRHNVTDTAIAAQIGSAIEWYECGSPDEILFQINVTQGGSFAAVFAIRYHIFTGWRQFRIDSRPQIALECLRLDGILHSRWFVSRKSRRAFEQRNPDCTGFTWPRVASENKRHLLP